MCAEAHGWWVETLGGWDIQCSCVSLSEAMREGVPVFSHHLMPQLGTQSLREQKGRTQGDPLFPLRSSFS